MNLGLTEGPELTVGEAEALTWQAGVTLHRQWHHSAFQSCPHTSPLACREPLQPFSLPDKPASDLGTKAATCCQMMTVTCPPDYVWVWDRELSHDRCQHGLNTLRPSSGESFHKHCQPLETFNLLSKVFNERAFDKNYATHEHDKLFLVRVRDGCTCNKWRSKPGP